MDDIFFKVVTEFSRTPSARVAEEGKHPGEELRRSICPLIRRALENKVSLIIDLDGAAGYGTSFLEEVFGGLIRDEGFSRIQLQNVLKIISNEEPELEDEIWQDINEASDEYN